LIFKNNNNMERINLLPSIMVGLATTVAGYAQQWTNQVTGFNKTGYGIFSLSVVNANVVWGSAFDSVKFISDEVNGYFYPYLNLFTRTTNGGSTWTSGRVNVKSNTDTLVINFIDALNKDTAWVSMIDTTSGGGSIYKTINGGASWTLQDSSASPMFAGFWGYPDYIHFFNDSVGVCIGDSNGIGGSGSPGYWEIYTTRNGGNTWTRIPIDSIHSNPASFPGEFGIDNSFSASGNTVWFGTNYGNIYRSTNMGAGWTYAFSDLTGGGAITIAMDTLAGLTSDGIDVSATTDGGRTWTETSAYTPNNITWLYYVPGTGGNTYFSTDYGYPGYNGSSFTTDAGQDWTTIDTLQHGAVAFFNSNAGWSGGFDSSTTRGGMFSWENTTGIAMFPVLHNNTLVYPNPMSDKAIIQLQDGDNTALKDASFILIDEMGNTVYSLFHINMNQFEIQRADLSQGIYFYRLITDNNIIGTGKIIVQ
jgi:photosystem II stability/assembly factor-like uncharacterized protein